ncbi:WD40/YVTN/BNR-like repeat-containing protein [Halpernia sp. GG3]
MFSPANPDKWYDGTAGGGVWVTNNAGLTNGSNTTDFAIPNLATTTVAISAANANVIYAGTGEPFQNSDGITGSGVVKSSDAGATWNYLNNTLSFGSVGRILVSPTDENTLLVGASSGIYRSTNGGISWTKTSSTGNTQDLKYSVR